MKKDTVEVILKVAKCCKRDYEDCTLKVIRLYRLSLDIQKLKDLCWKLT